MPQIIKLNPNEKDQAAGVAAALKVLQDGGLVVFPTETVYGLLADATNPIAIQKLIRLKKRRPGKAISVAVADQKMAERYVQLTTQAEQIYQTLLPGPVTVVSQVLLDSPLQPQLCSEFGTLGIRIPDYPLLRQLITSFDRPVTATSANKAGGKNPYAVTDILTQFSPSQQELIDLIIDVGDPLPKRPPSVVIDTTSATPIYFRGQNDKVTTQNISDSNPAGVTEIFHTASATQTQLLAQKILSRHFDQLLNSGLIIGLDGELGAGKTTFTQGLAAYLNIAEHLDSPTYTYLKEYNFSKNGLEKGQLFHLDVWKINSAEELSRLQLDQLFGPGRLVIIEWFSQIAPFLTSPLPNFLQIEITQSETSHPDQRQIIINQP